MDQGRLQQLATPSELVENPANDFVDQFLGQQRFQLALVTRTIQSILPEARGVEPRPEAVGAGPHLRARDSLIAALDLFKRTGADLLPVGRQGRLIGKLAKPQLLREITQVLGESGTQP